MDMIVLLITLTVLLSGSYMVWTRRSKGGGSKMKKIMVVLLSLLFAGSGMAWAEKEKTMELFITAEKEVVVINEKGEEETKLVDVTKNKVTPGEEVIYTLHYKNNGTEPAENVRFVDPIPEHMIYVRGSALTKTAEVTFSVDGGKDYRKPDELKVIDKDGMERPARAAEYTHIRWVLKEKLASGAGGSLEFRAKLE